MAFSGNYMCTSFKTELMTGTHNFTASTGNTFKLALYDNSASLPQLLLRIRLLMKYQEVVIRQGVGR